MSAIQQLCGFAAALERLLSARDAVALDEMWEELNLGQVGWEALALARRANTEALEPALAEVDRRLLAVLERCRALLDPHIVTFRVPELERWQHAAAAALVGARWGVAGLRTVIADTRAPLGRRYFAFLALAERHPKQAWPLFAKYLETPGAHHAFVAAAVEAARYYPGEAHNVIALFQRIRGDQMLRRFLGPKILESPFTSARGMAARHYRIVPGFLVRLGLDNLENIKRIRCPILIFHGTTDKLVPIEMGRAVAAAAAGPVEFVMIEGAGHNDTYDVGGKAYKEKLAAFVK